MATVQAESVGASFLFVGDLNGHHQELLGSTTTNHDGLWLLNPIHCHMVGPNDGIGQKCL